MTLLEQRVMRLSLAVRLDDAYAPGRRIVGEAAVMLVERPRPPHRNLSGDFLFLDLAPGPVTVSVTAALYLPQTRSVTLPLATPLAPVLVVALAPRWFYPFPPAATLVQGMVKDPQGAPIADGVVTLVERAVASRTGDDGRFVIALRGLAEDDVTVVGGRRLVKAGGGTTFTLRLEHAGYRTETVSVGELPESARTVIAHPLAMTRQ